METRSRKERRQSGESVLSVTEIQETAQENHKETKTSFFSRKLLLSLLLLVCVGIFCFSAYMLLSDYIEKEKATGEYEKIADDMAPAPEDGELLHNRQIDFPALMARNGDTIGWLWCPESTIDYPVVYSEDMFFYLEHTFNRESNKSGAIFVDAVNNPDFSDRNTTIHGHHMKNGSMFASLEKYKDEAYYKDHPVMYLYLPEQTYELVIFSSYVAHMNDPYTQSLFWDDRAYESFLKGLINRSAYKIDVEVTTKDRIVTLSTCTYNYGNARLVVHGVLKPVPRENSENMAKEG